MRHRSLSGSGLVAAVVTASALALPAPAAAAAPAFAPADEATIHPGVMTYTDGAQCTANFVFTSGDDVFLGQAAHCAGTGTATETDGCDSGSLPLGTEVKIEGATRPGVLAYSSWLTMQANGETDPSICAYNDFALVRIHPDDVASVNPTVPFFGGPTGLDGDGVAVGELVHGYGNSSLRLGLEALSPKIGTTVGSAGDGWTHHVYTVTPGIPGDSGSAFLSSEGEALGTLSTVQLAPLAGSNGVSDLANTLAYANEFGELGAIKLEAGTESFDPIL